jgi:cytochrome d ubiquinol oxidase subunit I
VSAFWILSLNSWMQTPAGYTLVDGKFHIAGWIDAIFNPSFPYRLAHMLTASFLTVAFLLAGVSAWQLLRQRATSATLPTLKVGLVLGAVLIPVQILLGDLHGLNTLEHQPAKIAAMEGVWHTERGAPLLLFAWPDEGSRSNRFVVGIARGASVILKHDPDAEVLGLNEFPDAHPPVAPLFWSFRVMVGVGLLMLAVSWLGCWWLLRKRALPRAFLWVLAAMSFSGWVATVAGWYVTEIGRQPWIVHGLLRTAEVASNVPAPHIALTLAAYLTLYVALIVAYVAVLRYLAEKDGAEEAAAAAAPAGAH